MNNLLKQILSRIGKKEKVEEEQKKFSLGEYVKRVFRGKKNE
jgi:hypothetical protein